MTTQTDLPDSKNHLPAVLRDSKVPWKPVCDHQAAAPRLGDSWTCTIGPVRFLLDVDLDIHELITWSLLLSYVPLNTEIRSWTYDNPLEAALDASEHYAELAKCLATRL